MPFILTSSSPDVWIRYGSALEKLVGPVFVMVLKRVLRNLKVSKIFKIFLYNLFDVTLACEDDCVGPIDKASLVGEWTPLPEGKIFTRSQFYIAEV